MSAPSLKVTRRLGLGSLLGAMLLAKTGISIAQAHSKTELPMSRSLRDELALALQARQPLVVMVSLHRCPWCDHIRSHYLLPMHAQKQLAVVQIDMRGARLMIDVQGQPTTHEKQARAWDVKVAPTLLFLGQNGKEVAERLVGGSVDFYATYLDNRLTQARQALHQ